MSTITIPILVLTILCFSSLFIIKFPIFLDAENEKVNENLYKETHSKNMNFFGGLYYALLSTEQSKFISFFSGVRLHLYINEYRSKFIWENKKVKLIHRFLDFCLMLFLVYLSFVLACFLAQGLYNAQVAFCILIIITMYKKTIFNYSLSLNVGEVDGYNLNVVYPYSTAKFGLLKSYGMMFPFNKTILIMADTFNSKTAVKDYVIAHERGHIDDNKRILVAIFAAVICVVYLVLGPLLISLTGFNFFVSFPLITYLIYNGTIGYRINESIELFADEYAIKAIGKDKCLEALNLMKEKNRKIGSRFILTKFFFRIVTIERRIHFVNEYIETEKSI